MDNASKTILLTGVYTMENRPSYYIGEGKYNVFYQEFPKGQVRKFKGVCENFCANSKSAFWNEEKQQMLVVEYKNIIGIYPIDDLGGNK